MLSGVWIAVLLLFQSNAFSEPRVVDYKEIPAKFEQYQDREGFLWQINKEGSLTSGETQYLPSGMKLFVNGKAFTPQTARLSDDPETKVIDLEVVETGKTLSIERLFWFDLERGGIRVLDTIKNAGSTANVKVELKTAFQFPWQNLVGTSGRILAGDSKVELASRDDGISVKFSVADGRQDTIILVRGSEDSVSPEISASSNSRELVLTYNLSIPAGQSRSLVHWFMRRNIGNLEDIGKVTALFHERGLLINSRIPLETAKLVQNFPPTAFPTQSGPPANVNRLIALNETTTRIGVKRKTEDILWASPNNLLTGTIDKSASVQLGGLSIPIAEIAAIEGGGGLGRTPRIFMRDGRVMVGEIELKNFALKVGTELAANEWNLAEMKLLLLALGSTDGAPPAKTKSFVELRSGEVLAVTSLGATIPLISVWGRRDVKLDDIEEIQYLSLPRPGYRLVHSDGSSLSVLPTKTPLEFVLASGETRMVDPRSIRRIWKDGASPSPPELYESRWIDLAEIPKGVMPTSGFLLQGNNLYAGGFADSGSITIIDGNSALDVSPAQIIAMRTLDPSLRTALPQFELELINGNVIKGGIRQASIRIGTEAENWLVPVRHIIAYRSGGGEQ